MSLSQSLTSMKSPVLPRILQRLSDARSHAVFVVSILMGKKKRLAGPSYHRLIADLLRAELKTDRELQEWLEGRFAGIRVSTKSFNTARIRADLWLRNGRWVASWSDGAFPPCDASATCPRVLFGQGEIKPDRFWAAFFNSRKPKLVSPLAEWVLVLRALLPVLDANDMGFASSVGTTTYDLVTVGARQFGSQLLLVLPGPLEKLGESKYSSILDAQSLPGLVLTCATEALNCPEPMRRVCRDRLLAFVSDLHCILELRPRGNLLKIIEEQQKDHPRLQWVYQPEACNAENAGNLSVLQGFNRRATSFSMDDRGIRSKSCETAPHAPSGSLKTLEKTALSFNPQPVTHNRQLLEPGKASRRSLRVIDAKSVKWPDYLYHYTRSCPGPWPGQSHRDYLLSLLRNEPLAEHTALAALIRILTEGIVRASSQIVRGQQAVVSWTSRPPPDLNSIRRWNPALIRWTFEPYGIAVKQKVLKRLGARPAIYGPSTVYGKLPDKERFRFQLHGPPQCSWKIEREWRLPQDFDLTDVSLDEAFVFVSTAFDLDQLREQIACALPTVVLKFRD